MIQDILDSIRDTIEIAYPNKALLAHTESIESNPITTLKDGYSVDLDSGESDLLSENIYTAITRNINIVITKGFYATDLDASPRLDAEEDLIAESMAIIKALKQSPTVRSNIIDIVYQGDTGIKLLQAEKLTVLNTVITMVVRYKEYY